MRRAGYARALGVTLAAVSLVVAASALPAANRGVHAEVHRFRTTPHRDGVPDIAGVPRALPALIAAIRRTVPAGQAVRVITPAGTCASLGLANGDGTYFWLMYEILPRVATCDPRAHWWIWLSVSPAASVPVPPGAETRSFATDLVLAKVPA